MRVEVLKILNRVDVKRDILGEAEGQSSGKGSLIYHIQSGDPPHHGTHAIIVG